MVAATTFGGEAGERVRASMALRDLDRLQVRSAIAKEYVGLSILIAGLVEKYPWLGT